MTSSTSSRTSLTNVGIEGVLMTLAALPFLLASTGTDPEDLVVWRIIAAATASLFCLGAAIFIFRKILIGKIFGSWLLQAAVSQGFLILPRNPRLLCSLALSLSNHFFSCGNFASINIQASIIHPTTEAFSGHEGLYGPCRLSRSPVFCSIPLAMG